MALSMSNAKRCASKSSRLTFGSNLLALPNGGALRSDTNYRKHRVLLIESYKVIRELIKYFFQDKEFEVVGEAEHGLEALSVCQQLLPSLAVIDPCVPGLSATEVVRCIRKDFSDIRVVVFSGANDTKLLSGMLQAKPHGFVRKSESLQTFLVALRTVMAGGRFFSPMTDPWSGVRDGDESVRLSAREREVLQAIAEGRTNKQIAVRLGIAAKTVENHRTRMMQRLNLHSVAALTKYALRIGLIDLESIKLDR